MYHIVCSNMTIRHPTFCALRYILFDVHHSLLYIFEALENVESEFLIQIYDNSNRANDFNS